MCALVCAAWYASRRCIVRCDTISRELDSVRDAGETHEEAAAEAEAAAADVRRLTGQIETIQRSQVSRTAGSGARYGIRAVLRDTHLGEGLCTWSSAVLNSLTCMS
jgi:hypothetical protein